MLKRLLCMSTAALLMVNAPMAAAAMEGTSTYVSVTGYDANVDYTAQISLRDPNNRDKYIGTDENWEKAERAIIEAAEEKGLKTTVELGEAAFYGPKLDFMVKDAIGRKWQLGTIQVDYNLPERFDLEYTSSSTPTYAGISNAPGDAFSDIVMFETDRILPQLELYGEYDGPGFDFYTKIRYKFDKERTELLESYFTLPLAEDEKSNFVVGRFKTQFGIEKLQSSTKALTCNASSVSEAFNLGRAWGGSFEFELDNGVFLALGMMNDPNDHRIMSSDNYLVAHVVAPLGEHSKIGGSALVGQHDIGEGKEIPVQRYGLEYQYKNGKWRVDAEALYSNGYNGVTDNFTRAAGAYVGTAYTILPPLDGVLFVDWFDLDLDRYSSGAYNEEINARTRFVVGLNYYFDRKKVKRLMCNYEWHIPNEGPSISNNGLYVYYSHSF